LDHQSVGLIARTIEESDIPTVYIGSCRNMMAQVKPPRSLFVNFPLGRQCGPPNDRAMQIKILKNALNILESASIPGDILNFSESWNRLFDWPIYLKSIEEMLKEEGV